MNSIKNKRTVSLFLATLFICNQTTLISAMASEITGVNGNNGVYNINPTAMINGSDIGYRKYKDFNLDKGDIANLIYQYGNRDVETFVNLVDNKININGVVNSMRDGNFYNGKAIFVSPNGMVVGASGVLNVGSLSITTPTQETYNYYKANPNADLTNLYSSKGNSTVTIDGRAFATNNIDITSGNIIVNGSMLAGTGNNSVITNNSQSDALFNTLVNTQNIHEANNFNSRNGNIQISSGIGTAITGNMQNLGKGNTTIINDGTNGILIKGNSTNHNGNTFVINNAGEINIQGTLKNENGNLEATNNGTTFTTSGTITNSDGKLALLNNNGALDITKTAKVSNTGAGTTNIENHGINGINVYGGITSEGDLTMTNTGDKGILVDSSARVNGNNNISISNNAVGGTNIKGLVNAGKDVNISNSNSNVVIGDNTENNNYISAGKDINISVDNGNILNYGVEKTLLAADGNLNMNVTNGTIGSSVQQTGASKNSTGIGPKSQGTRDFTKSINGNIKGKVNASTTDKANTGNDLVINYAAIDSDMNIDTIKADGRVILTVDDSSHAKGGEATGVQYNMVNASTDSSKTNVIGKGISLISNGSIGTKENKVTFIQTDANNYKMDALANNNIYLKENSFNDANYGRDKEVTTNTVSTMIARKGDLDVEFAGNTEIENITAEGDLKVITRGKNLHIKNLGHIEDAAVIPQDYFGPRDYGTQDGGYMGDDYKNEALPNNAIVKALDINHNIRPTTNIVDGKYEGMADSTVRIDNAVLDKGKLDITADNVYANGVAAHFKDEFTKVKDESTNKVIGTIDGVEGIPTAHAVRPDDVTGIGRDETERNYYYPQGDGDGKFNGVESNVDPDDDIVDATPLEIPDVEPDPEPNPPTPDPDPDPDPNPPTPDPDPDPDPNPPTPDPDPDPDPNPPTPDPDPDPDPEPNPPTPDPDPDPDPEPNPPTPDPEPDPEPNPPTPDPKPNIPDEDGSITYIQRKIDVSNVDSIDKRQYMRFNIAQTTKPVTMERSNSGITNLIDVSRGGIAVKHNNTLKVGDIVPVHLTYGNLDIKADVKIVSASSTRAGAEFVNIDKSLANQLLYLNIMLESDNNMLKTKLSTI